jgi:hypothetical protein
MIHYHGTPLTPKNMLYRMAGKNFCCSFNRPDNVDWCLINGQSVMLDNSAFTIKTKGIVVDWNKYFHWLENKLGHPHWAVVPDVIDGDIQEQRALTKQWTFSKDLGAPVWHMALPIDYLIELAENWPRICFGSSGKYWELGTENWERRCDEAWNCLEQHNIRPWIHMMRGMAATAGDRWPFASSDSVNVARNFKDTQTCPERMARRLDAIQTPMQWKMKSIQPRLI